MLESLENFTTCNPMTSVLLCPGFNVHLHHFVRCCNICINDLFSIVALWPLPHIWLQSINNLQTTYISNTKIKVYIGRRKSRVSKWYILRPNCDHWRKNATWGSGWERNLWPCKPSALLYQLSYKARCRKLGHEFYIMVVMPVKGIFNIWHLNSITWNGIYIGWIEEPSSKFARGELPYKAYSCKQTYLVRILLFRCQRGTFS